ncbi:MAG: gliding motility-associated C-terminal domain-containing protein, partial [Cyclobacteriaceae bacterium]
APGSVANTSNAVWRAADCDGDGVTNGKETDDGTDPKNLCDYVTASQTGATSQAWKDADCDGDGDKNGTDTSPKDPCVSAPGSVANTSNAVWRAADCDGDGVTNGKEIDDGTDPDSVCSLKLSSQTVIPSAQWQQSDCDGDGVTNKKEKEDGTDIFDFCSLLKNSQSVAPSPQWKDLDCDNDGTKNEFDKNIFLPVALDDEGEIKESERITIDIIGNDDFMPGQGISISRIGGSAEGEYSFDALTGEITYRGFPGQAGVVTIIYRVCNIQVSPPVCADATVRLNIDGSPLIIPEAFTPNDNGKNDKWIILGLAAYPENKLTIFNRWGNQIYSASPYKNDWEGYSSNPLTAGGSRVPAGSYFYILELGDGKRFTGFVYVAY